MRACADCRYLVELAIRGYTGAIDKRCGRWQNARGRWASVAWWRDQDVCEQWAELGDDERAMRTAYFALTYREWQAEQRKALTFTRRES